MSAKKYFLDLKVAAKEADIANSRLQKQLRRSDDLTFHEEGDCSVKTYEQRLKNTQGKNLYCWV